MTVDELFDNPDGGPTIGVPGGRCPVYLLGKFFGLSNQCIGELQNAVMDGYKLEIVLQAVKPGDPMNEVLLPTRTSLGYVDTKTTRTAGDFLAFEVD